jgi:hypothetical protein
VGIDNTEVWVHGNLAPEINGNWFGIVGPGVKRLGIEDEVWSDHTDIRPTMLAVLGLTDDFEHQGRVVSEFLEERVAPASARRLENPLQRLGAVYKQLNAPVGEFALATLRATTRAVGSGSASDDSAYSETTRALARLGEARDELSSRIARLLDGAWFHGQAASADEVQVLIKEARDIIERAKDLATDP